MPVLRTMSAEEAVKLIEPGMRVRVALGHVPMQLADQLFARMDELHDVEVAHTSASASFPWFTPGFEDTFPVVQEHWASQLNWPAMRSREMDYLPMPFSLRFKGMREGRPDDESRRPNVVLCQTSPPDSAGNVNLGRMIWDGPEYIRQADIVLAEIDESTPMICGDGVMSASNITAFIEGGSPGTYAYRREITETHRRMAEHLAPLIGDGATLQIGAGTASLVAAPLFDMLRDRNDLGWHSEATPLGLSALIRSGNVNSTQVAIHPGVAVSSSWPVEDHDRDLLERNPAVQGWEIWRVTDPRTVSAIEDFTSMNSVMMIDLSGQAAAESVGTQMCSGVGGLLEFMIGALWANRGQSILVTSATDGAGRSRIVPSFPHGTQVSVPRTLVDKVVTEYGVARLFGKTARERAKELTAIAAPQFRGELEAATRKLFYP